jgi:hypothetical protein
VALCRELDLLSEASVAIDGSKFNAPGQKIDASRVAARPGKAGDKTKPDRVFADTKDDWYRRARNFRRERSRRAAGSRDHGHTAADQLSH